MKCFPVVVDVFFLMLINTKFEQVAREAPVYSLDALVADFGGTLRWILLFYSPRFHFSCLVFFLLAVVSFTAFMFSVSSLGSASWLSGTSCWLPCHGFKHWQERFLTKLSASLERIDMHKKTHDREFACDDFKRKKWQAENKQDKVNTADSAFIFLIILLISQNQWPGCSGRRRWSCRVWSLLER